MTKATTGVILCLICSGCGGASGPKYPPPVYQRPVLPEWQAEEHEPEEGPIDFSQMDGEWVVDEDEDETDGIPPAPKGQDGPATEEKGGNPVDPKPVDEAPEGLTPPPAAPPRAGGTLDPKDSSDLSTDEEPSGTRENERK